MKPIVELIQEWSKFDENHSEASVEDFCKYFLARRKVEQESENLFKGLRPPDVDTTLTKLIGRIAAMQQFHTKKVLKEEVIGVDLDGFYFLNTIFHLGECKKKDVIEYNFYEQSTGIDILNRLLKKELITEKINPDDRRAKLVQITSEGKKKLFQCWEELSLVNFLIYNQLSNQDMNIIVGLLEEIEIENWQLIERNFKNSFYETLKNELEDEAVNKFRSKTKQLIQNFNKE